MKINIIPSVYMTDDEMPALIVSCKTYNMFAESKAKHEMEFYGLTPTAEGNFKLIYEAFGIPYSEGLEYPISDPMKLTIKKPEDREKESLCNRR